MFARTLAPTLLREVRVQTQSRAAEQHITQHRSTAVAATTTRGLRQLASLLRLARAAAAGATASLTSSVFRGGCHLFHGVFVYHRVNFWMTYR